MASILKVDDLRGNTSAGNITITAGANNSTTMTLQEGVVKARVRETHAVVADSHNVSSLTDGGTGDTLVTFTNNMNNTNFNEHCGGFTASIGTNSGYMAYQAAHLDSDNRTTSTTNPRKGFYTTSGGFGDYQSSTMVIGDLA